MATRQFLTPDGAPYLEVQAEIMAEGLQWLMSDSLVRAGVEWTVVAYDTTGQWLDSARPRRGRRTDPSRGFRGHRPHSTGARPACFGASDEGPGSPERHPASP